MLGVHIDWQGDQDSVSANRPTRGTVHADRNDVAGVLQPGESNVGARDPLCPPAVCGAIVWTVLSDVARVVCSRCLVVLGLKAMSRDDLPFVMHRHIDRELAVD